jgi:hypothetical protein
LKENMRRSRIFGERELSDYVEAMRENVSFAVESENDNYILNVNEDDYVAHLISDANIEC